MPITPTEAALNGGARKICQPLFAQNSECVGWICIHDTHVNYPGIHTPDNPQKHLRKNFYGEYSQSGVPFLDENAA